MALRMYPISASRWEQLAASRHPIDLTDHESRAERSDAVRRRVDEHAEIQAQVDAVATRRVSAPR